MKYLTTFVMVALTEVTAYYIQAGWVGTVTLTGVIFAISYFAWEDN